MDPVTTAVARTVTTESAAALKRESEGFLKAVLGEPAKALGGLLADKVNSRRHANLIKITVEAKRNLVAAGVSPAEVPLKIIHPMLEAASLEEDPDMQTTWANLLANAADPRSGSLVSPSFPIILKELSSREVRFLDALYETCLTRAKGEPPREPESVTYEKASLSDIYARAGLSRDVHLASNYTEQLGRDEEEARTEQKYYLAHQAELDADVRDFDFVMDVIMRHQLLEHEQHALHVSGKVAGPNLYIHMRHSYRLSQLGGCFIKACRKPPA